MLFYASNSCSLSKCYSNLAKYTQKVQSNKRKTTSIQLQKILKINNSTVVIREFATNAKINMQLCYFMPLTTAPYRNATQI